MCSIILISCFIHSVVISPSKKSLLNMTNFSVTNGLCHCYYHFLTFFFHKAAVFCLMHSTLVSHVFSIFENSYSLFLVKFFCNCTNSCMLDFFQVSEALGVFSFKLNMLLDSAYQHPSTQVI